MTLARAGGVRPDTIRYYERLGLIAAGRRTSGDHRRYDAAALDRLRFIRGAQRLGLRLADIRILLDIRDHGNWPCDEAAELLRRRLDELDTEIERLQRLRGDLARLIERVPSADCPDPSPETWRPIGGDQ